MHSNYYSSTLLISKSALLHNLHTIRDTHEKSPIAAVVKANAYGHGMEPIAGWLQHEVDFFCVARVEEGIQLRQSGITKDILVFTAVTPQSAPAYLQNNLIATFCDWDDMQRIPDGCRIHLNIDTGMGRLGIPYADLGLIKQKWDELGRKFKLEGVYSHFSDAEDASSALSIRQAEAMDQIRSAFETENLCLHFANSAASATVPSSRKQLIRAGISLYGYTDGFDFSNKLQPVLKWQAPIVSCRKLPENSPISYGGTWKSPSEGYVGVLAAGYADGIPRGLSSRFLVGASSTINTITYQQVGRVTMDHIMVWLGDAPMAVGTSMDILNGQAQGVQKWAQILETIPYEICTSISDRVRRIYQK